MVFISKNVFAGFGNMTIEFSFVIPFVIAGAQMPRV
jgi:hypothetical protein